jgi:hypothetical protein
MTMHELKCWRPFFQMVQDGTKMFEYRKDDRGFKIGDELCLVEVFPPDGDAPDLGTFCGRPVRRNLKVAGGRIYAQITSIVRPEDIDPAMNMSTIPEGHCIMGIRLVGSVPPSPPRMGMSAPEDPEEKADEPARINPRCIKCGYTAAEMRYDLKEVKSASKKCETVERIFCMCKRCRYSWMTDVLERIPVE